MCEIKPNIECQRASPDCSAAGKPSAVAPRSWKPAMPRIAFSRLTLPLFILLVLLGVVTPATPVMVRTIELHKEQIDRAANISEHLPEASWVGETYSHAPHLYMAGVYLEPKSAFLIHYDLSAIPENMRITKAEWMIRATSQQPHEAARLPVATARAVGAGVSFNNRMTDAEKADPEKKDAEKKDAEKKTWDQPGAAQPRRGSRGEAEQRHPVSGGRRMAHGQRDGRRLALASRPGAQ